MAKIPGVSIERLDAAGAIRKTALGSLRASRLQEGGRLLELAMQHQQAASDPLTKNVLRSFDLAVEAYKSYKYTHYDEALSLLELAHEIDGSVIKSFGIDILRFHQIQLTHNRARVLLKNNASDGMSLLHATILRAIELESSLGLGDETHLLAWMMIDQLLVEVAKQSLAGSAINVSEEGAATGGGHGRFAGRFMCALGLYSRRSSIVRLVDCIAAAIEDAPHLPSGSLFYLLGVCASVASETNLSVGDEILQVIFEICSRSPSVPPPILRMLSAIRIE
ncbi:MAG: hypothetical protein KF777_22830 [Planctomycetaceae bacterium]|nr:hypothetical protein [Planctomycetaceae bacterium]